MQLFLEAYWERGGSESEDIAVLMSGRSFLPGRGTMDPAQWDGWLESVRRVLDDPGAQVDLELVDRLDG
jgi:hypothetical protein